MINRIYDREQYQLMALCSIILDKVKNGEYELDEMKDMLDKLKVYGE